MIGFIKRLVLNKALKKQSKNDENSDHLKQLVLSKDINDNIARLKNIMNNNFDIKSRVFNIGGTSLKAAIMYIDNLVDEDVVLDHIFKPLIVESAICSEKNRPITLQMIEDSMISAGNVTEAESFDQIVMGIMSGDTFITVQGYSRGLMVSAREYESKQTSIPTMEPSVKGPQEAFIENLKRNIGLIRKRIRDPNLKIEKYYIGRRAKSDIIMVYIKGVIDERIVDEAKRRLAAIDIDSQVTTIQVGILMSEKPNSIFPLFQTTERPDRMVAALVEGRLAVMIDGSPDCVMIPTTLPVLLQSVEDYFENWIVASIIRSTRYVALLISSLFPALYIAITTFNPGMLPTNLVLSIAATRSGVPFPAFVEALLMEFTLEILQEAGIRLPRVVGQTVSIVGGLVIGQAAVQAGVVSPIMVIVISITAVASFTIPDYSLSLATRVVRIPFMILAVIFGSYGIVMGMLLLLTYLASLKSYGIRYLEPISPYRLSDWKDTFFRAPLWTMKKRPEFINPEDTTKKSDKDIQGKLV